MLVIEWLLFSLALLCALAGLLKYLCEVFLGYLDNRLESLKAIFATEIREVNLSFNRARKLRTSDIDYLAERLERLERRIEETVSCSFLKKSDDEDEDNVYVVHVEREKRRREIVELKKQHKKELD